VRHIAIDSRSAHKFLAAHYYRGSFVRPGGASANVTSGRPARQRPHLDFEGLDFEGRNTEFRRDFGGQQ
jgi:hypothetical protein